jgi:hypothetical protein
LWLLIGFWSSPSDWNPDKNRSERLTRDTLRSPHGE